MHFAQNLTYLFHFFLYKKILLLILMCVIVSVKFLSISQLNFMCSNRNLSETSNQQVLTRRLFLHFFYIVSHSLVINA